MKEGAKKWFALTLLKLAFVVGFSINPEVGIWAKDLLGGVSRPSKISTVQETQPIQMFLNIWAWDEAHPFDPLPYLTPNTEVTLAVDISLIPYDKMRPGIFTQSVPQDLKNWILSGSKDQAMAELDAFFFEEPDHLKILTENEGKLRINLKKIIRDIPTQTNANPLGELTQGTKAPFVLGRVVFKIKTKNEGIAQGNELRLQSEGKTLSRFFFPLCNAQEEKAISTCEDLYSFPVAANGGEGDEGTKGTGEDSGTDKPSEKSKTAYWNSWVQPRQAPHGDPLSTALEANRNYSFVLDLSPYPYQQTGVGTATPSPEFIEEFKNAPQLVVYVRPVLGGRGLAPLNPDEFVLRRWEIPNLAALRQPGPKRQSGETLQDFSQRVRAGQIRIGVQATSEGGCAVIGLSIWNENQDRPLDHLVHTVAVADASGKVPESCDGQGLDGNRLRAGLLSLMTVKPDPPATAGIHIFKLKKSSSAVIYVERQPEGTPAKSFAWTFPDDVGAYFQNHLFVQAFNDGRGEGYGNAANLLSNVVFDGNTEHDQAQATLAQQALAQLQAKGAPVSLFVRLVDEEGTNRFLPLGLLKTGTSLLGEHATLLYPLPRESYGPSTNCIANWTLAIPDKLDKEETLRGRYAEYVQTLEQGGHARIKNIKELECYLQGGVLQGGQCQTHTTSPRSEGLILLAHHAKGDVWFDNSLQPLRYNRIKRRFPPGSVAILSACSTAELDSKAPRQMPFVGRLNEKGIDAAILSPFEVPLPLGLAFVQGFHDTLQQAYTAMAAQPHQPGPTIQELFTDTIHAMQKSDTKIFAADPNVEFLLAGNAGLRLCPIKEDDP